MSGAADRPVVAAFNEDTREEVRYRYLGRSFSGVHLLQTWHSTGGSGVFCHIVMVTLGVEPAIAVDHDRVRRTERFVIKKVAAIPLGDRYGGDVKYEFGLLRITACGRNPHISARKMFVL